MAESRLELLDRIRRLYPVTIAPICLGGLKLEFARISEPDRVLDDAVAAEDRRRLSPQAAGDGQPPRVPYWAELWESSLGLGQRLAREKRQGNVLDLGCGMGLAGAAAAAMGANVLLADCEATALLVARFNSWPWRQRVRTRRVNWQTDRLGEKFDMILGADILYERAQWEFLDAFWKSALADGGSILLGEPGRAKADEFAVWANECGWKVEESMETVEPGRKSVRIFELRRLV